MCLRTDKASGSFTVIIFTLSLLFKGVVKSVISPFTSAATELRASPSLIFLARSRAV